MERARMARLLLAALALSTAPVVAAHSASAKGVAPPLERPAVTAARPEGAAYQALTAAGDRLVAVGERGVIILSDDGGATWRQAKVPVSVTLTAVSFPTPKTGWAVGHYGVVLNSRDGGETWVVKLDGVRAAEAVVQEVPPGGISHRAGRLVEDGPDKPFLDLFFPSAEEGFVVGAYGLMLHTVDGGRSWRSLTLGLPNREGNHLYAIRSGGGSIWVAGEQGLILRSDDGGKSFEEVDSPYEGSWFVAAVDEVGGVTLAGLRGNAYHSDDRGASWRPVPLHVPVSVTALTRTAGGELLFGNQAGQLFASDPGATSIAPRSVDPLPTPTGIRVGRDGGLVLATLRGMRRLPPTQNRGDARSSGNSR